MNSMLKLAEVLCHAGLHITFLNFDHNQQRLLRFTDAQERFNRWPRFRFQTITDGLPADHPCSVSTFFDMLASLKTTAKPLFCEIIIAARQESGLWPPLSCVTADGLMPFAIDVAEELHIPAIVYRAINACRLWAFFLQLPSFPFQSERKRKANAKDPQTTHPANRQVLPFHYQVRYSRMRTSAPVSVDSKAKASVGCETFPLGFPFIVY